MPLLNYFLKSVAKFNNLLAHEKSYAEDSCYLIKTKVQRLGVIMALYPKQYAGHYFFEILGIIVS